MTRRRLLGAAALATLAILVAVAAQRPDPFARVQTVRADLVDAGGLAPIGADVRVAGVPVGSVASVSRSGAVAQLRLAVDASVGEIHRDATVALAPRLMFEGTAYVELSPGSPGAPPLGDRVIPTAQTSTYVPLEDTFAVLSRSRQPDDRAIAAAGAQALAGPTPAALRSVLAGAPTLAADTAQVAAAARGPSGAELQRAVQSLSRAATTAAAQAPAIGSSLATARTTLAALDTDAGRPLAAAVGALPALTDQLTAGAGAASAMLDRAQRLVPRLIPDITSLRPTLAAVRPLLRGVAPVAVRLAPVLGQAQTALDGGARGAAPAQAAIHALEPALQILQRTLIGALAAPTDLGDPAYLAFLGLFEGGGGASGPFGVDGQGHFMRFGLRFLTGAGQPLPPCADIAKLSAGVGALLAAAGGCTS